VNPATNSASPSDFVAADFASVEQIAAAVLYEGYVLYPYRASAVKNRQRWNFGGLYPRAYSDAQNGADAWNVQTECLISGVDPTVHVRIRFLHLLNREVGHVTSPRHDLNSAVEPEYVVVDSLEVDGRTIHTWQEAIERDIDIQALNVRNLLAHPHQRAFSFPADRELELIADPDADARSIIVRKQEQVDGTVEISAERLADNLFKLRILVRNDCAWNPPAGADRIASDRWGHDPGRDEALLRSLASTHIIMHASEGEFASLLDPPEPLRDFAAQCHNVGAWPVLAGNPARREFLLCSPIILYDYPQIAPESAGNLFDGTEIDEILTLRIHALTDEEKEEMRNLDDRARAILERTESLPPEQLAKMHGAMRSVRPLQEQDR
jgi:hydrogenase maturation protease